MSVSSGRRPLKTTFRGAIETEFWLWLFFNRDPSLRTGGWSQGEGVVGPHELLHAVLFQDHHPCQAGASQTSAVLTVHHVALPVAALAGHKQQVKHLQIALVAVVGWFVLHAALVGELLPCSHQLVPQNLNVLHGLHETVFDHLKGVFVGDLDGAGHVPGHVDHGNDGLDLLELVPLEALQR